MLSVLREHSKSFLVYLMFGMIIVVFVLTFNTGGSKDVGCTAPEVPVYSYVYGEPITRDTLVMASVVIPRFFASGPGLSFILASGMKFEDIPTGNFEEMTAKQADGLLRLIETIYVASREAEELGFRIPDEELAKTLYTPFFEDKEVTGEDGLETTKKEFDAERYNGFVRGILRSSPQEYQTFVNRILLALRMQEYAASLVGVTPMETELAARAKATKANLSFFEIDPASLSNAVTVSPEEAAEFLKNNEKEVVAWYDSHPADFPREDSFDLRGIFLSAKPKTDAPAEKKDAAPAKPEKPKPEEMAAAKTRAEDVVARTNTIEMPLSKDGIVPLPVDLKPGADGKVKIDSKDLEDPKTPADRFARLAQMVSDHETKGRSGLLGTRTMEELKHAPFGEAVPAAFANAKEGTLVGPVEVEDGYWVFWVEKVTKATYPTLDAAKPEVARILAARKKAPEFAKTLAEELRAKAVEAQGKDLDKVLENWKNAKKKDPSDKTYDGISLKKTGMFSMNTKEMGISQIGKNDEVFDAAFQLTTEKPVAEKIFSNPDSGALYVIVLAEQEKPAETIPAEDLAAEKDALLRNAAEPHVVAMMTTIREKAMAEEEIKRTDDYNAFRTLLQERDAQKAKEGGGDKPPFDLNMDMPIPE